VYIAETNSVIADFLGQNLKSNLFACSEYFGPSHASGEVVNGVLHQDLQRTSFEDASFDVVITSEVFEHIPDAIAAEAEVMRILKPGGIYCFTVPFFAVGESDVVLADLDESGQTRYFAEPQYHRDPLRPEGVLVYRIFSFKGMKQRFEAMGHEFKTFRFWSRPLGILGSDGWAHVVQKRL
jgi:SAM-dependent methyltransferase